MKFKLSSNPSISINCPKCGHKFTKMLRGLEDDPKFRCPSCGQGFNIKKFIDEAAPLIKKFREQIGDVFRGF